MNIHFGYVVQYQGEFHFMNSLGCMLGKLHYIQDQFYMRVFFNLSIFLFLEGFCL
jgi:hypothetical protein